MPQAPISRYIEKSFLARNGPFSQILSQMSASSSQLLSTNLSPPGESAESTLPPVSSPYSVHSKSSDLDGKSPASIAPSFASPRPFFSLVPPQLSTELGRHEIDLLNVYSEICKRQLCDLDLQKVSDGIHVSLVTELSLIDYVRVRQIHCSLRHRSKLSCICDKMLHVAEIVLK